MNRFQLKTIVLLGVMCCAFFAKSQNRPNILWINCDDLGCEVGCYGTREVYTPNIDRLASEGVLFLNAYANAPVCSSSRSSQITGVYPSAIHSLNHRTVEKQPLPQGIVPVTELFRAAGYYCSNGSGHNLAKKGKDDFNFVANELFDGTDWAGRQPGQPFFAQVQIHEPHRTFAHDPDHPVNPDSVKLPRCYPDHPLLRADWALYLETVQLADKVVGDILDRLEKEGLAENTVVFLFGDNGRPHLRDKQWLYEGGLRVPLIVRNPFSSEKGSKHNELISLVDVTASSLALAGIEIPEWMHGKNVLGGEKRSYVLGFRQRCGDALDDIRSITDGRYKLIWNRMPEIPYMQLSSYKRLQYPAFSLYKVLYQQGRLPEPYSRFMAATRPELELYDLKNDPEELRNLAGVSRYRAQQNRLFSELKKRLDTIEKDMVPESEQAIEKAIRGSQAYFEAGMKKRGLPINVSDEELLLWWEQQLLKN